MQKVDLVLNSNKWFSAVSDYSLQLAIYLKRHEKSEVIYGTFEKSPLVKKCKEAHVPLSLIPFYPNHLLNFLLSFFYLHVLFKKYKGREHTLCALHRLFFFFLWKNKTLVRVRGQAQGIKSHIFSRLIYEKLTHKVVFAASVVKKKAAIHLPPSKTCVALYCKDLPHLRKIGLEQDYRLHKDLPPLQSAFPLFLVVARFDPVKGHNLLLEAYEKASLTQKTQMCFIGRSENISFDELCTRAQETLKGRSIRRPSYAYFESFDGLKTLFIIDDKREDIATLQAMSHFGIISSLNSEVICRVAVEFLNVGTPLIATKIGALEEVLAPNCSLMVEVNENIKDNLISQIEKACKIIADSNTYKSFSDHAYELCQKKYILIWFSKLVSFVNQRT
jgi:glycosyltransferase involved in cell wall biosynthesis